MLQGGNTAEPFKHLSAASILRKVLSTKSFYSFIIPTILYKIMDCHDLINQVLQWRNGKLKIMKSYVASSSNEALQGQKSRFLKIFQRIKTTPKNVVAESCYKS